MKKNLKAPTTAKFPASFEEYKIKEVASGKDDLKEYVVDSYVDAENSFGAKIRSRFVVKLQIANDMQKYKILDVKIMENKKISYNKENLHDKIKAIGENLAKMAHS